MCDPITMIGLALGALGAVGSLTQKIPEPPEAEMPAIAAPTSRAPGATVRLGNSDDDIKNTGTTDPNRPQFSERRASGNSLGNLGRSSLAI